jgi:hypothetical protein
VTLWFGLGGSIDQTLMQRLVVRRVMSSYQSIILGVVAGIITAISLFLLKELWLKSLLPLYQKCRYQGADVSGAWTKEYEDDNKESKSTFSIVLTQNSHKVTGSMYFTNFSPERKICNDYTLTGEYWEGYLTLNARSKDRKVFSNGSMFLKLTGNGKCLDGYFAFRNSFDDVVTSKALKLDRN